MEIAEVPCPQVGKGQVLIQTKASLVSAGTEKMLVEFSKANLISKARYLWATVMRGWYVKSAPTYM